ncbi:MAG: 3,4-dihydroxy-2-butanone-4-phosphate synthase [Kineosporiaceae bacterium]
MSAEPQQAGPDVRLDEVEAAVAALRAGLPVLVVDDADRENEGDVILAAQLASPRWIAWTVRHTSGVLCAPMPDDLADRLDLPPMVARNEDPRQTAYTVSVDARQGVGTGISAADRTTTVRLLASAQAAPSDFVRPGHVFPLRARPGGVLERRGHTEASVDLCRLAGLAPVGVIAEVVDDDGTLTRLPGLRALADAHGLPLISVADLVAYRSAQESGPDAVEVGRPATVAGPAPVAATTTARVARAAQTVVPTAAGTLRAIGYRDLLTGDEHVALLGERPGGTGPVQGCAVRVHSECLTGDAFGSLRCDCGPQLEAALRTAAATGGVVVYLRGHEGRGIGLLAKLNAYRLQDGGLDTVEANAVQGLPVDAREYGAAAAILADLGLTRITLLTNNPAKVEGLRAAGIDVERRQPLEVGLGPHNTAYLTTKRDLLGHHLSLVSAPINGSSGARGRFGGATTAATTAEEETRTDGEW